MRFVVCGAGAIGGVLGRALARAGYEVLFIEKLADHRQATFRAEFERRNRHTRS